MLLAVLNSFDDELDNQGYFCDEVNRNTIPEVLSQKDTG
jgi:hypothetical protein